MKRRLLITSGLPYANGPIHLGHMVEAVQTDVFARAMRMRGHEALYMCADDTHGTPIELRAHELGVRPEDLIAEAAASHKADFAGFGIDFANYYTTHSEENRELSNAFFSRMKAGGYIHERTVKQLYSEELERFLPDRFVKGKCPKCGATEQYGDVCESCKARYDAVDLVDARCVLDGNVPVVRESAHLFVSLSDFSEFLREYCLSESIGESIRGFVLSWIDEGLQDWNISRDKPYFGFEIPGYKDKYFYVWMDAPIGYLASTWDWCKRNGRTLESYWKDAGTEIWHFIGKDIIYFHCLFWPAMLKAAGYNLPHRIHTHGFLTVNGKKMSKSRGTFILAADYLKHLPADYLRFYIASKLSTGVEDIDLNIEDFYFKTRSGLIDNLANLHNRSFSFAESKLGGELGELGADAASRVVLARARDLVSEAIECYETIDTAAVMRKLLELGDLGNAYYQEQAPWSLLKGDAADIERARRIVTTCAELVRMIAIAIKPVVPKFSAKIFAQLGLGDQNEADLAVPLGAGSRIQNVEKTYIRPERETFDLIIAEESKVQENEVLSKEEVAPSAPLPGDELAQDERSATIERREIKEFIEFDDFLKLDLRVGEVLVCERVKKSDKLLRCEVEIGHPDGPVQIVAGIGLSYEPTALINRRVVVLCNLKPRKLFGLESRGMILAATDADGLELPSLLLRVAGSGIS
ncbi:MAG: methionine--tRNA ligase [Bradymonadales bacterium]|jgi:methionyl-tRNA synthetase